MEGVIIDKDNQRAPLKATSEQLMQMLQCIENEILPKTERSVYNHGNKVFGAAILDKNFKCIFADTNTETECPIFHGEVKCIYAWSQATPAKDRGHIAQSSIFLSTHEPCCMCISSILWAVVQYSLLFLSLYYHIKPRDTTRYKYNARIMGCHFI